MAFEIEDIKKSFQNLGKTIKDKPYLLLLPAGAAGLGIYVWYKGSQEEVPEDYFTLAYPEEPYYPEEEALDYEELDTGYYEGEPGETVEVPVEVPVPVPYAVNVPVPYEVPQSYGIPTATVSGSPDLESMIQNIYETPTITFHPQGSVYTPEQVEVIGGWAAEEQAAISRGTLTSLNPPGLAESDMKVTYYPTGHVAFTPRGEEPPPAPTTFVNTEVGRQLEEAQRRETSGETRAAVSKVTGKTGSVEEQLAGLSGAEKLAALRAAGLAK